MNIQYAAPLSNAVSRMKKILFKPFDLSLWLAVGLSSFIAGLTDGKGGMRSLLKDRGHIDNTNDIFEAPYIAWEWIQDNPGWTMLIIFGVIFLIGLSVLLTWLSSRGKFLFVHNVVTGTGQISRPWADYKRQGNSLTLWRLIFGVVTIATMGLMIFQVFLASGATYHADLFEGLGFFTIFGFGLLFLAIIAMISGVSAILNNFIVPIMYHHNLTTNDAWRKFLPVLKDNIGHFILYLLFLLLLHIGVGILIVIAMLLTCCVGFLLLVIPYINAIALLPISVSFRAFSMEYLSQFAPDFNFFESKSDTSLIS
ncbi:hypothetical protein KAR48_02740 [bacterium]|nr:hypothetical protein [bacterium]